MENWIKFLELSLKVASVLAVVWAAYQKRRGAITRRRVCIVGAILLALGVVTVSTWWLHRMYHVADSNVAQHVGVKQVLTVSRDHARQCGGPAPGLRFLVLNHLSGSASTACQKAVEAVLGTAVHAVDTQHLIYALDLSRLDANPAEFWYTATQGYPYGLDYEANADAEVAAAYRELVERVGDRVPCVRGDWWLLGVGHLGNPDRAAVDAVAREYERPLSLADVAAELDCASAEDLAGRIHCSRELSEQLGLAALVRPGASLSRGDWCGGAAGSRFQKAARELHLGTPLLRGPLPPEARSTPDEDR